MFTCVDSSDPNHRIYLFEDFSVRPKNYTLPDFFTMWIKGVDLLSHDGPARESIDVTNPFTGKKARVTKPRGS